MPFFLVAVGLGLAVLFVLGGPPQVVKLVPGRRYRFVLEVRPKLDSSAKLAVSAALQAAGGENLSIVDVGKGTRFNYTRRAEEARELKPGDVLLTLAGFDLRFVGATEIPS